MSFRTFLVIALLLSGGGLFQSGSANAQAASKKLPVLAETYRIGDNAYVRAMAINAATDTLWVGTSVGAMAVDLNTRNLKGVFTRKEGLANEYVFAIGIGADNSVYLGTNAGGFSHGVGDGKWKTYFPMHGLADYWVYSFAFDKKGNPWIGTWDGVSYFEPASGKFTTYREELINVWAYGIDIDSNGRVWIGTEGGVSMFDNGKWTSWDHDDGLGAPNVDNLPRSPNTGLGTRSRHDLAVGVAGQESYNPNYVFSVLIDQDEKKYWFGTWGGGATYFDGDKTWGYFTKKDGLAGSIVYSIAQETDGTLWFGTDRGASRYDGKTWTTYNRQKGVINDHIYAISIDSKGMIWLGSKGGVTRLTYGKK